MEWVKYEIFLKPKVFFFQKINENLDLEMKFELIFCGGIFYDVWNMPANNHSKIPVDLKTRTKTL
jgi:hypothetical protein